jgi:hypothetical protein
MLAGLNSLRLGKINYFIKIKIMAFSPKKKLRHYFTIYSVYYLGRPKVRTIA